MSVKCIQTFLFCTTQTTGEYELLNYSEHGTVVDGILFSCDFSDKEPAPTNPEVVLTVDDYLSLGTGRRALQAQLKLESARKSLRDKQEAKKALEAALRLSAPVKDDFSLAEEMSKCEGLMTRTGLKRVAATEGSSAPSGGANSNGAHSTATGRTKKSENPTSSLKKANAKKSSPAPSRNTPPQGKPASSKEEKTSTKGDTKKDSDGETTESVKNNTDSKSVKEEPMEVVWDDLKVNGEVDPCHGVPCGCLRSLSSVMVGLAGSPGGGGSGWEGTAALHHGTRLCFGCLQFIVSLAGHPGHSELVQVLSEQGTIHQ